MRERDIWSVYVHTQLPQAIFNVFTCPESVVIMCVNSSYKVCTILIDDRAVNIGNCIHCFWMLSTGAKHVCECLQWLLLNCVLWSLHNHHLSLPPLFNPPILSFLSECPHSNCSSLANDGTCDVSTYLTDTVLIVCVLTSPTHIHSHVYQ